MPFGTASGATEAIVVLVACGVVLVGLFLWLWRWVTSDVGSFPEADSDSQAEGSDPASHRYYSFEEDFFRAGKGNTGASEVLRNGRWVSYKGDPLEPVVLGKPINGGKIPGQAGEVAELLDSRSKIQRQLEIVRTMRLRTDRRDTAVVTGELKEILAGINQRLSELQPGTGRLETPTQ